MKGFCKRHGTRKSLSATCEQADASASSRKGKFASTSGDRIVPPGAHSTGHAGPYLLSVVFALHLPDEAADTDQCLV
jgi:hypothetical protein